MRLVSFIFQQFIHYFFTNIHIYSFEISFSLRLNCMQSLHGPTLAYIRSTAALYVSLRFSDQGLLAVPHVKLKGTVPLMTWLLNVRTLSRKTL